MASINKSLLLVNDYLKSFYQNEPNNITSAKNAVWAGINNRQYVWHVSNAFREVIGSTEISDGTLQDLVVKVAKRDVWSEEEARQFLQKVYDDTYLDDVAGFDDEAK